MKLAVIPLLYHLGSACALKRHLLLSLLAHSCGHQGLLICVDKLGRVLTAFLYFCWKQHL